jgi:hypothetical protein
VNYSLLQIESMVKELQSLPYESAVSLMHKLMAQPVPRFLLTPAEAAESYGFTYSAWKQADWTKDIPAKAVKNQRRYIPDVLKRFAENLPDV